MQFTLDGHAVCGATGGRPHAAGRPLAVFVHGAGCNHTVWALQSRWLAFRGWNVLALDLPGHGRSAGPPLRGIRVMARWLASVIGAMESKSAALIGHSMGALIALETAAHFPERVQSLALIASAAAMPVQADLLAASAADARAAIDMVNHWGYGYAAWLGGSRAPGIWMVGAGERMLAASRPGVLHADLAACNGYADGTAAAKQIAAPALLICGEHDRMIPLRGGRALAAKIRGSTCVVLPGAGHMLMAERPEEVRAALAAHLKPHLKTHRAAPVHDF